MESVLIDIDLETPVQAHRRRLQEQREIGALATIPPHITGELRTRCEAVARRAVAASTARQLRRVVWPWQARPERTSVPRGRQGVARAAR